MVDALIKENVDGFDDTRPHKFVSRAVSHILSLATSITRDPADGTSAALPQRTGGRRRLSRRHAARVPGRRDQAALSAAPGPRGRASDSGSPPTRSGTRSWPSSWRSAARADINLTQVTLADAGAAAGKTAFMDPLVGRCNECHSNAGANALDSGKNRNFNTGTVMAPATPVVAIGTFPDGSFLFDGGFGGQNQTNPNFDALHARRTLDSFGDGTFNTPPLIEAADTGPFFHQHGFGQSPNPTAAIESGVAFYETGLFLHRRPPRSSTRASGRRSTWVRRSGSSRASCACSNASFNLAMAKQRLDASHLLNVQYWGYRDDIQKGLLRLASKEIDDARRVLANGGADLHAAQQTSLASAQTLLDQAIAATDPAIRKARTESATTIVQAAKSAFGTNMNFQLGTGNLMF